MKSKFEEQQSIALIAIHNAVMEVHRLKKIVEEQNIPNHKNYELDWAFDGLVLSKRRIIELNIDKYKI
jgi:hypothetical protein